MGYGLKSASDDCSTGLLTSGVLPLWPSFMAGCTQRIQWLFDPAELLGIPLPSRSPPSFLQWSERKPARSETARDCYWGGPLSPDEWADTLERPYLSGASDRCVAQTCLDVHVRKSASDGVHVRGAMVRGTPHNPFWCHFGAVSPCA